MNNKRKTERRLTGLLNEIKKSKKNDDEEKKRNIKKVHVRWKRYDHLKREEVIVPQRSGGGYRFVMLDESELFSSLKEKASELYFPDGTNFFNENLTHCHTFMTDASNQPLEDALSVKDYLKQNGVYISKTYFILHSKANEVPDVPLDDCYGDMTLITCPSCNNATFGDPCFICMMPEETLPYNGAAAVKLPSSNQVVLPPSNQVVLPPSNQVVLPPSNQAVLPPSNQAVLSPSNQAVLPPSNQVKLPPSNQVVLPPSNQVELPPSNQVVLPPSNQVVLPPSNQVVLPPSNQAVLPPSNQAVLPPSNQVELPQSNQVELPPSNQFVLPPSNQVVLPPSNQVVLPPSNQVVLPPLNEAMADVVDITVTDDDSSNDDSSSCADTVPVIADGNAMENSTSKRTVRVHRMNIKEDLIREFKSIRNDETITFEIIDPRGLREEGIGVGVERDLYACFWIEVLDSLCIGEVERVPFVRHDLYFDEWEAIGKILCRGFVDVGYFPIRLSQAFMIYVLFGRCPNDIIITSFLNYLAPMEKTVVNIALKGTVTSVYDEEEFLDVMDRFNCRSRITILNVYGVILELAQQELIQKPYMMVCSWKSAISFLKQNHNFKDTFTMKRFYDQVKPTNKKVVDLLQAEPQNEGERNSLKFFIQYIKGLDSVTLVKLLRFVSGADIIIVDHLQVSFISMEDSLQRRPIAHTCAPMLELPNSYRNFCELREEFQGILNKDTWTMDSI